MNQPEPVISLPLDRIVVGRRLRPVDSDYVALLAASMADSGQHTPIHVGPANAQGLHPLITGAHRVAAARSAGLAGLQAIIFRGDALEAELLEIDENLMRRGLSELDRGVFLARRQEVYLALHPETGRGGNRRKNQNDKLSLWSQAPAFGVRLARAAAQVDDIEMLLDAWKIEGKPERAILRAIARKPGSLRLITKTLKLTHMLAGPDELEVTAPLIRRAFSRVSTADVKVAA